MVVNTEPTADVLRAAVLGCSVAVVMALELNQPVVAAKMAAFGVMFEGFARAIERRAARQPRTIAVNLSATLGARGGLTGIGASASGSSAVLGSAMPGRMMPGSP